MGGGGDHRSLLPAVNIGQFPRMGAKFPCNINVRVTGDMSVDIAQLFGGFPRWDLYQIWVSGLGPGTTDGVFLTQRRDSVRFQELGAGGCSGVVLAVVAAWPSRWKGRWQSGSVLIIKVLYCFHQNNDDSECEVAHTSLPIRPSKKSGTRTGTGTRYWKP